MSALLPCCFAVVRDEDDSQPLAVFQHLEDALDWANGRFRRRPFRIRQVQLLRLEEERSRAD